MDPKYDHAKTEAKIYEMWESGCYFTPKIDKTKKPFTIILPLPNAKSPRNNKGTKRETQRKRR
jgi:valyl-tRNA synthetase